jgi:protein SCO1/2
MGMQAALARLVLARRVCGGIFADRHRWLPALTRSATILLLLFALASPGCRRAGSPAAPTVPAEKTYPLTGEIVQADPVRKVLLVRHDPIPGLMPAMTMEFFASGADVAAAQPGQRIRATLLPEAEEGPRLEKIWPADPVAESTVAAAMNALRQDTSARARHAYREVGENLPGFALYDQEGRVVSAAQFQGKQVLLNFIYTRCPIATMCPAATTAMIAAQAQARAAGVKKLELVSITLDPDYDTPAVLKDYAKTRGMDTTNFTLLTGPERAIRDLFAQFGISAEIKDGLLSHNLATLLINADGKIIWRVDGSQWKPEEFVARMRKE